MKKYWILCLLVLVYGLQGIKIKADSDYLSFESITIYEGKFLSDYTEAEYKTYFKEVNKRRFAGWNVH